MNKPNPTAGAVKALIDHDLLLRVSDAMHERRSTLKPGQLNDYILLLIVLRDHDDALIRQAVIQRRRDIALLCKVSQSYAQFFRDGAAIFKMDKNRLALELELFDRQGLALPEEDTN
jgi:hypothetical protein